MKCRHVCTDRRCPLSCKRIEEAQRQVQLAQLGGEVAEAAQRHGCGLDSIGLHPVVDIECLAVVALAGQKLHDTFVDAARPRNPGERHIVQDLFEKVGLLSAASTTNQGTVELECRMPRNLGTISDAKMLVRRPHDRVQLQCLLRRMGGSCTTHNFYDLLTEELILWFERNP